MRSGASSSAGVGGAVFLNEMSKLTWPGRIGSGMLVSVAVVSPFVASEGLSELSASPQVIQFSIHWPEIAWRYGPW